MKSKDIRKKFLRFFEEKGHRIVPSAPMVSKDDPTLMFTNAGMNQFKDYFLGHKKIEHPRIADTQKCLRVSGKHNDLEEVGRDSYHHTMFEMLGNWSFGDYFKKEAIAWSWELLTEVFRLPSDRMYVTIFGGDESEDLARDTEAGRLWQEVVPADRVLAYGKEDNFWEMGDTGPCGPCSEIHIDLRPDDQRSEVDGRDLVNTGDPTVIELWNLVFIQHNRRADGSLESLPLRHVDTGMGFERLVMVIQGKKSSYDTDIFTPLIHFIEQATGIGYTDDYNETAGTDIAMRVIADHVRALYFGIADGQLPSNTGAGYVLRRILRRGVRYAFSFLGAEKPLMHRLVPLLTEYFEDTFPESAAQNDFIAQVIREEEKSFLNTLDAGLKRLDALDTGSSISGEDAFELYDTYGFPIDLTRLIAEERGVTVDEKGFQAALEEQKRRSRADARKEVEDWIVMRDGDPDFVGYDTLQVENTAILKYRKVLEKEAEKYQIVLDATPFYPEGGGQVGDRGVLIVGEEEIPVVDTIRENELPIVVTERLPKAPDAPVHARVDRYKRKLTENNHTATHLLHAALRQVLGDHVRQKGSLLNEEYLRFDFSHFQKMTPEEIREVERIVNARIRENVPRVEDRTIPMEEAKKAGAMMLFGEKYGDQVRMITFDPDFSIELCGGCHVERTGSIGLFKITSESAVAAGVRRIEAVTADRAEQLLYGNFDELQEISHLVRHPKDLTSSIEALIEENKDLRKAIEEAKKDRAMDLNKTLQSEMESIGDVRFLARQIDLDDSKAAKTLTFQLTKDVDNAFVLIAQVQNGKVQLHLGVSQKLADAGTFNAGQIVKELAAEIGGGGGGQPFYASAGGPHTEGIDRVLRKARDVVTEKAGQPSRDN